MNNQKEHHRHDDGNNDEIEAVHKFLIQRITMHGLSSFLEAMEAMLDSTPPCKSKIDTKRGYGYWNWFLFIKSIVLEKPV